MFFMEAFVDIVGKCLPKDTKAIAYGFDVPLLKLIDQLNESLLKGE
jgi:UDP-glucose 6-dehydrogenase